MSKTETELQNLEISQSYGSVIEFQLLKVNA